MRQAQLISFYADFKTGLVTADDANPFSQLVNLMEIHAAVHPDFHAVMRAAWIEHLETGVPACVEAITQGPDGMSWSDCSFEAVRGDDGAIVGVLGARQDISRRKAAELEMVEQSRRAEAASHAKGEFLASMSHEIRTPLNGILTMAQVMAHGELSNAQRDLLCIVRQSGQDLLHLLNDILDFSKIEAGKLALEQTEFDPEKVL